MNVVDRRQNPKGKSLSNRQRFLERARAEVKGAVQDALRKRKVADVAHGEKISIPTRGITEPTFHHNHRTGRSDHVVPGNKEYVRGDEIPRPQGGGGGGGSEGSPDGGGDDSFEFTLTKEEFLDMFFEDLELPDLIKKSLKDTTAVDLHRAGYTVSGSKLYVVDGHTAGRVDPGGVLDVRQSDDRATLARVAGTSFFRRYLETFSH